MNYLGIAARMLNVDDDTNLPKDLEYRLSKVALLTAIAGGELRSRQIIATVVTQWIWDNPKEVKRFGRRKK